MTKLGKPYERPLSPELAEEILNIPFVLGPMPESSTIGEHVARAVGAVRQANEMLATSGIAKIIAKSLMRDLKKRGEPTLFVAADGTVMLRIAYETPEKPTRKSVPVVRTQNTSKLPKLAELRAEAERLGLDCEPLGRQRRAIFKLITDHKAKLAAGDTPEDKPKTVRRRRKVATDNGTLPPEKEPPLPLPPGDLNMDDLLDQLND